MFVYLCSEEQKLKGEDSYASVGASYMGVVYAPLPISAPEDASHLHAS